MRSHDTMLTISELIPSSDATRRVRAPVDERALWILPIHFPRGRLLHGH